MKSEEFIEFFDPIELFSNWFADAKKHEEKNYNAFCLATSDVMGVPSARMILLKSFDERGFIFFTNSILHLFSSISFILLFDRTLLFFLILFK